jgi:hypothetical protein
VSIARLAAIGGIFAVATAAWLTLGLSIVSRTGEFDSWLRDEVAQLWGGQHRQQAPAVWIERERQVTEQVADTADARVVRTVTRTVVDVVPVALTQSRIDVALDLDHRQKGLLWYDTYAVDFRGRYRLRNPDALPRRLGVKFAFPSSQGIYDNFQLSVNQQRAAGVSDLSQGLQTFVDLPANGEASIDISYTSRGLDTWNYAVAEKGVAEVSDFELAMTTDFRAVDFPAGTMSPGTRREQGDGWLLTWRFGSLVTGQSVGMDLPNRLNPGPLAARITIFAPVSLLFFLTVLVILGALQQRPLHPMNYVFLSAAFFAFHLLLAYLADHVDIHVAFAISSAVSVLLVVSYLRIVAGAAFALFRAGLAQLVFLVLFSYAFFFDGYTGLTVTIGAILTLFVLMQMTARIDWSRRMAPAASASTS